MYHTFYNYSSRILLIEFNGVLSCPHCLRKFTAKIDYIRFIRVHMCQNQDKESEVVAVTKLGRKGITTTTEFKLWFREKTVTVLTI